MLRDLNVFRRNSGKIPPAKGNEENIPIDPSSSVAAAAQLDLDPSRDPLHVIQEPIENNKAGNSPQAAANLRRKIERTPSRSQARSNVFDGHPPFRTPEKLAAARSKFGWAPRAESRSNGGEIFDESSYQSTGQLPSGSRGVGGGYGISTPRAYRMAGKASSVHSDSSSTQSTPTKSVSKPCYSGSSRPPLSSGPRTANFSAASKGVPMLFAPSVALSTPEVPYFELKEDPSFWMENNVQAVIRVRPLNGIEKSLQGYNRCLKQDSAQSIVWIGQPEARFTFDHVACETVSQEMLFRVAGLPMVENCMSGYNSCVFAYGQTGSGKTYTMLGEIDELEFRPSPERGMTPRIFEFLFARIKAEEESRRDEKLKYNCKCSFLEIYNEQITDLLDPASTNLLLREDLRKGVYVENLTEFEVESVRDILKLLIQGAANRKVATTNMNRESSRSHSVFTCVIESRWEKDSTTNLRFARLNLVDLAGSERQKASGAEGERLKEAANINKSLSTLGHVIMILADVAHGRQRHIPYRDSRLTFLLQDSLGGNSKTMIIANVSPSICCANETLSTLKFAQRARLIQNNAVINEDASGDVIALQHQIRLLKEELSVLQRQNVSRSLSFRAAIYEDFEGNGCDGSPLEEMCDVGQGNVDGFHSSDAFPRIRVSTKQLKSLEATLAGALRREKMADTAIRQLEAEIEQLNRLVRQREEDARSSKMMLKFREDKIHRMESLLNGLLPSESYLMEENNALSEEIQLLRVKVDRNPEVTRFALENIRLLDQIRKFQDYYEEGERELLLNEVSELRDQLLQIFDGKYERERHSKSDIEAKEETCEFTNLTTRDDHFLGMELEKTCHELEVCKNDVKCCLEINSKLHREINDLQTELDRIKSATHTQNISVDSHEEAMCLESPEVNLHFHQRQEDCMPEDTMNHSEQILNLQLELDILKDMLKEEKSSRFEAEERAIHANNELNVANQRAADLCKLHDDVNVELKRARSVIEALESQHLPSINEIEKLTRENGRHADLLKEQEQEMTVLRNKVLFHCEGEHKSSSMLEEQHNRHMKKPEAEGSPLQVKMKCMQASLEKARTLNMKYQSDQASQTLHECEMDEVRRQVEAETAEVIVCLQEELIALQQLVDQNNRDKLLGKESLEALQSEMKELNERLMFVTNDNRRLSELVEEKEREVNSLMGDWERLAYEIAEVLDNGNAALEEASLQACTIADTFPQRSWVGEQVGRIVRSIYEKDELIYELQNCLEDAQNIRSDMEWKLRSLRGATLAITEAQQQETSDKEREILSLTSQLSEKTSSLSELQGKIRLAEDQIRKSEVCATIAFMVVNKLSEKNTTHLLELEQLKLLLNQSEEILSQKDVLVQNLMLLHVDAEKRIQELKFQLAQHPGNTVKQAPEHAQEREETQELDHQIEKEGLALSRISNDLRRTRRRLNEFCVQVNPLQSHSNGCVDQTKEVAEVYKPGNVTIKSGDNGTEDRAEIEMAYFIDSEQQIRHVLGDRSKSSLCKDSNISRSGGLMQNMYDREATIILLREEIESALDSLEGVQAQMVELLQEKENRKTEMPNEESVDNLVAEVLKLKSEISNKEQQYEVRLLELENKLHKVEENALTSHAYFCKAHEELELEVNAAKAAATQKTVEASRLLAKIEEAQETMRDADAMVNALLAANKSAKQEIERLQKIETTLNYEMSGLMNDIQILQSSFDRREREYEDMENKFLANLTRERSLVLELEETLKHLKATFTEKLKFVSCDLDWLRSQIDDYAESARSWLEDIWSEIIGKDCAVSVLHLCHMGIFLEMLTGLNTENSLLSRGLCESNSVIADLKEHNVRSKKELEMCSILKGKLLADINNSFNRITKKEDETVEFRAKISSFEKKIWDLQLQEESMWARSNSMGAELSMLMKELDVHNQNTIAAASVQEKLLLEKETINEQLIKKTRLLDSMGAELSMLMKELDVHNQNTITAASVQEKLLLEKETINEQLIKKTRLLDEVRDTHEMFRSLVSDVLELLAVISRSTSHMAPYDLKSSSNVPEKVADLYEAVTCEAESLAISISAKNFEVLVLQSELEQKIRECQHLTLQIDYMEGQRRFSASVVDRIMEEMILHELEWNQKHNEMNYLLLENEMFKSDLLHLKEENSRVTEALQEAKVDIKCCSTKVITKELEIRRLEDDICTLTACLTKLQTEMDMKNAELENLECTHTVVMKELDLKIQAHEVEMERTNALVSENEDMKNLLASKRKEDETMTMLISKFKSFIDSVQSMSMLVERIFNASFDAFFLFTETMQHKICQQKEMGSKFVNEINFLESSAHELISRNLSLQSELARKDEASKVLLYDLSLLQESASNAQDKTDEVQELTATLTILEDELARKASQCKEALADKCMLQALLQENNETISALRLELDEKYDALNLVSRENRKLKVNMEHSFETKAMIDEELKEKSRVAESLEEELHKMRSLLGQKDNCLKDLHSEMAKLADEREYVDSRMLALKEELEMAQALAEENEAIATEARQLAEGRKAYVEEKEQEVRLLEKSVEELERTVNAMESKVEMVKEEAERQRLQREEIELELQALRHQMFIVPASSHVHCLAEDNDIENSRQLQEKVVELQDAHKKIKRLCKEVADKDAEILQCKAHISELNMHAEAQAREYKQKFKELEAMAQQVKPEHASSCNSTSLASTKSEKTAAKSRASGSPFKCIGLGLAQQINSEKDEELTAARRQIEELEALVASKQKELFMLNTRLAAAESMTHDIIRDLLGVKLDITNYASLLDNQQAEKAKETENFDNQECQHKDLVLELRRELNELIQERQSWLDDVNRKQYELMALRVTMEKLRQREQTLTAENEMLKANISAHKKMVMELEHEVEKLTKQQNLQHRIHHHAKIKEENIFLKIQNDDLNARFRKSEALLSRVKEELAHYRTASGKKPSIDLDEEEQLKRKLEESEEERIHLAKKLLRLSTSILKAAGCAQLASSPSPSAAEDALHQLTNRINSLESELEDLKLKCKVYRERLRLAELEQETLPACLLGDCGIYSSPSVTQSPSVQKKCFEDGISSYGFSPS